MLELIGNGASLKVINGGGCESIREIVMHSR